MAVPYHHMLEKYLDDYLPLPKSPLTLKVRYSASPGLKTGQVAYDVATGTSQFHPAHIANAWAFRIIWIAS
jgi:hypothetical protein